MSGPTAGEIRARRRGWSGDDRLRAFAPDPMPDPGPPRGKAIVICCDGTSNDPNQKEGELSSKTNVCRLYEALTDDSQFGTRQITWYDAGVGTDTSGAAAVTRWIGKIFGKLLGFLPDWLEGFALRLVTALESGTGAWIEENIEQGYREIVRNFEPGDRIFIFGFSRGAYTARCIAGLIGRCGLLKPENIRFTKDAMTLYRRRNRDVPPPVLESEFIHDPALVQVHVLGLWDTVASLGLPLWGWWFRIGAFWRNRNLDSSPAAVCRYVYHALSMDEQRSQFFPTVTTPDPSLPRQEIRQIWLRGVHADVGGGYGNRALGNVGLEWMLQIARYHGLSVRPDIEKIGSLPVNGKDLPVCGGADPLGKPHDEIKKRPAWIIFGSWPRWASVPRPGWSDRFQRACTAQFGAPHDWVYHRAFNAAELWSQRRAERTAMSEQLLQAVPAAQQTAQLAAMADDSRTDALLARDGLIFLSPGQTLRVKVTAATVWNRTGIVFESTGIYRVSFVGGAWRDAEAAPCGAWGQRASIFDFVRRAFSRSRRLAQANWMELIGHVAHPRDWPVEEFGFQKLLKFLFWQNPKPLTRSLIRMGRHMPRENQAVDVVNLASNGLFYMFANDAWATYKNNSGAIEVDITRLSDLPQGPQAAAAVFAVTPRGEVVAWESVPPQLKRTVAERNRKLAAARPEAWPPMIDPAWQPPAGVADAGGTMAERMAFADATGRPKQRTDRFDAGGEIAALDDEIERLLENPEPGVPWMLDTVLQGADRAIHLAMQSRALLGTLRAMWGVRLASPRREIKVTTAPIPRRTTRRRKPSRAWMKSWSRDEI